MTFTEASYTVQEGGPGGANSSEVCVIVSEGKLERDGKADINVTAMKASNATGQYTIARFYNMGIWWRGGRRGGGANLKGTCLVFFIII